MPNKDFTKAKVHFALVFPDLYEVGMSNLGIRILYGLLNSAQDVICERFFSLASDMENYLRQNKIEIFSLESKRRIAEFELIGFSLGSELNYTNVLNILELGNIPLKASLRDHTYPLIIGGGPCTLNPEPLCDFFDLFIIGEAEDAILDFIKIYRQNQELFRSGKLKKEDLLFFFSQIEGVYVPSFYEVKFDSLGNTEDFKAKRRDVPSRIRKRIIKNLDSSFFPQDWLIPHIQIIHDRITLEVMRGCPNVCRFCQARSQYYPLRIRSLQNIEHLAKTIYENTGYEEIALMGLSVSDYPDIEKLLSNLICSFKKEAVGISLPSIKNRSIVGNLSSLIATIKKTGLTFAPEAGSARLRKIIGKDFEEDEFFKTVQQAYKSGYRSIKLYFMIGLPYEREADLDDIIKLAVDVSELRKKAGFSPAQISLSINSLIPKPHTSLQWFAMEPLENIKKKQDYIKTKVVNKRLKVRFHERNMSYLEAILSRGDRRLGEVILYAFRMGAKFDAWDNHFNLDNWLSAFKQANIDPDFYVESRPKDKPLPWDFIDTGIHKDALISDFNKIVDI